MPWMKPFKALLMMLRRNMELGHQLHNSGFDLIKYWKLPTKKQADVPWFLSTNTTNHCSM